MFWPLLDLCVSWLLFALILVYVPLSLICREGLNQVGGARDSGDNSENSDVWVDDPISRHIISLQISGPEDEGCSATLIWPLILHLKGNFQILILPLVEPRHLKGYATISRKHTRGSVKDHSHFQSLSSMLLELPCVTG